MTETATEIGDVSRLKSLLFRKEQQAIDDMRNMLDDHHERIGSDTGMRESVSGVLADALRDARVKQHKQVADAIAPLLVEGMKREIKNSRDEMVDALYPIMGRLVSAYVASAVADVMNQTNQRLESGLSGRFLYLRGKALLTGQSYEDLAVADRQRFQINELMLIRRGSGVLLDHMKLDLEDAAAASSQHDSAMVSGVVAAIHDFAQEAFSGEKSSLRSVDMGDETIYLRATSGLILAVVGRGKAKRKLERALDSELLTLLEERSADIQRLEDETTEHAPKILPAVADRLMGVQIEASQSKPILAILFVALLGAAIAGYVAWSTYESWQTERLRSVVMATISEQSAFDGFPIQVNVAPDRSRVQIAGFAPSTVARDELVQSLDQVAGETVVAAKFNIIPSVAGVEERLNAAEASVADVSSRLTQARTRLDETAERAALNELTFDVARILEQNRVQRREVDERAEALQRRIAALEARPATTTKSTLGRWILDNGVFFGDGTTYRDPALAAQTLSELRQLMRDTPSARIRIVGYSDIRGRAALNATLAQDRSERVAADLLGAGITEDRIIAVGRQSERQFSTRTGPESGNRRVEFELLFKGE